jgi:hypothetical protein
MYNNFFNIEFVKISWVSLILWVCIWPARGGLSEHGPGCVAPVTMICFLVGAIDEVDVEGLVTFDEHWLQCEK